MPERCQLISLDITGDLLDQSVKDPALAALVAEGWTMGANMVTNLNDGEGKVIGQKLSIVMVPPRVVKNALIEVSEPIAKQTQLWNHPILILIAANVLALGVISWFAKS